MLSDVIGSLRYGVPLDFADVLIGVLSSVFVIFCTMPVHEYAHALIADKLGDPTARLNGRLSINPLKHIDYFGALMIILFGFGYAKPVPVNMHNLNKPKRDMAFVALAGPTANVIMALAAMIIGNIIVTLYSFNILPYAVANFIYVFFKYVSIINISLAAFNLIPIPPLDGSRILFAFTPNRFYYTVMQYERYIYLALIIAICTGVLNGPISTVTNFLYSGVSFVANIPFKAFGII